MTKRVTLEDSHVATRLPVQDLERARLFYEAKLGLEPVEERHPSASKDKKAMKLRLCICLFLSFWIRSAELKAQEAKPTFAPSLVDSMTTFMRKHMTLREVILLKRAQRCIDRYGLDKQLPLIMQLDRLSNKQIVEILSAADPLASVDLDKARSAKE